MRKFTGKYEMISKHDLIVDPSYQTDERGNSKKKKMKENFSEVSFGTIAVSRRNGKNYVVDGQQRVLVTMTMDDIDEVPCLVHEGLDVKMEASAFVDKNVNTTPVSSIDKFKAKVVKGESAAIAIANIVRACRWKISSDSKRMGIKCISKIERIYSAYGEDVLVSVLNFAEEYHEGIISRLTAETLAAFEYQLNRQLDESIHDYSNKLADYDLCVRTITNAQSLSLATGNGAISVNVNALVALIDKRKRNKLSKKLNVPSTSRKLRQEGINDV